MGRTKIVEGQDTIDRVKAQRIGRTKSGKPRLQLVWYILVPGETEPRRMTTTAAGVGVGELRELAHKKAEAVLEEARSRSGWTARSSMRDYLERKVESDVEASSVRPCSKKSYRRLVTILGEEAEGKTVEAFCNGNELVGMLKHADLRRHGPKVDRRHDRRQRRRQERHP